MKLCRYSLVVIGVAILTGCTTTRKPDLSKTNEVARAGAATPDPNDPLPPGLTPKFLSLLTGEGLTSSTSANIGEAVRLTAAWNNKVAFAPDPTKGGEPMPSLVVRLWLFGPDHGVPVVAPDGEILVALWDSSKQAAGEKPILRELWHIDRETAMKFRKPDAIGDGYTLLLPWSNYHVDIKQVNLLVRYNGADGRSLASPPEKLSVDHSATLQRMAERLGMSKEDQGKAAGASALADVETVAPRPWPERGATK